MSNGRQFYIDTLSSQFKEVISVTKSFLENEIYISTKKENLVDVCLYIRRTFNASLSSMICNDERSLNGNFRIYYVFSMLRADIFLIVHIPVSEDHPEFPSITTKIPAAHWYEREIKDMFGLEPVGHPDPCTLVLHGNMPEKTYPLRKDFDINTRIPLQESKLPFFKVEGEGVFEIPVEIGRAHV